MNSVNIIGRITKDPELRTSSNGKTYVAFTVAVNEFSGGNQFTQFVPCFAWEKTAENMAKYVKKGGQLAVEGSINVRQDNSNGQVSSIITVRANRVEFLSSSNGQNSSQSTPSSTNTSSNNDYEFNLIEEPKPSPVSVNDDDAILWDD